MSSKIHATCPARPGHRPPRRPFDRLRHALRDESGAITVDWVVLTAGVVLLGVLAAGGLDIAIQGTSDSIATEITNASELLPD